MTMKHLWVSAVFLFVLCPLSAVAFDHHHGLWDIVLKKHVVMRDNGTWSQVDYRGITNDKALMGTYLNQLSSVRLNEYDSWSRDKKLAFLINAYNAFTIDLVVRNYKVKSIRDIGSMFKSVWSIRYIPILGRKRSLDEIEHELIRQKGVFDEPRIHVALVCASIGCPPLKNEAYTYENLNDQLEKALILFLSDKTRNRYDAAKKTYRVSPIFKWYEGDFKDKYGTLEKMFIGYARFLSRDPKEIPQMMKGGAAIEFGDYNWNLNDR